MLALKDATATLVDFHTKKTLEADGPHKENPGKEALKGSDTTKLICVSFVNDRSSRFLP